MQIKGFQKTTFIDYPNKVSALVFTGGCNFRCPYCHNGSLVLNPGKYPTVMPEAVFQHLEKRKGVIEGLVITGGEPTLVAGLTEFVEKVKGMGVSVKLDTNGTSPELLKKLIEDKLIDYVAMDIKHVFSAYPQIIGTSQVNMDDIKASIKIIIESGIDHEFRTTVIKGVHNEESISEMVSQVRGANRYILQQYVKTEGELMANTFKSYSTEELERFITDIKNDFDVNEITVRGKY